MVDITPILVAIITVLGSIITAVVIPWLRTKINAEKQAVIFSVADAVVLAVEQVLTTLDGSAKKDAAIEKVQAWLKKYGITADMDMISDAIEAAVKRMNMDTPKE